MVLGLPHRDQFSLDIQNVETLFAPRSGHPPPVPGGLYSQLLREMVEQEQEQCMFCPSDAQMSWIRLWFNFFSREILLEPVLCCLMKIVATVAVTTWSSPETAAVSHEVSMLLCCIVSCSQESCVEELAVWILCPVARVAWMLMMWRASPWCPAAS